MIGSVASLGATLFTLLGASICSGIAFGEVTYQMLDAARMRAYQRSLARNSSDALPHAASTGSSSEHLFAEILATLLESKVMRYALWLSDGQQAIARLMGLKPEVLEAASHPLLLAHAKEASALLSLALCVATGLGALMLTHSLSASLLLSCAVFVLVPMIFRAMNRSHRAKIRKQFEHALPDMMQLIVLSIQAGASFDTAFKAYGYSSEESLALSARNTYELYISRVMSRSDALDQLASQVDSEPFYRFVATVKRALYLGSPLANVLEGQLRDIETFRKEQLQEEISKKPVQMLLPLGLFILPGMLIILLGPVLMEVIGGISVGL